MVKDGIHHSSCFPRGIIYSFSFVMRFYPSYHLLISSFFSSHFHANYQFFLSDPSPIIGNACHLLTNWLTDSLTPSRLVDLMAVNDANLIYVSLACADGNSKLVEVVDDDSVTFSIPTQSLLRLLLLLMLMLRIMLATACWFGSWRLVIKLNICSDFEHKGWSRL